MNQRGERGRWRLVSTSCWWKWLRDLPEGRLCSVLSSLCCSAMPPALSRPNLSKVCYPPLMSGALGSIGPGRRWRVAWKATARLGDIRGAWRRLGAGACAVGSILAQTSREDRGLPPPEIQAALYVGLRVLSALTRVRRGLLSATPPVPSLILTSSRTHAIVSAGPFPEEGSGAREETGSWKYPSVPFVCPHPVGFRACLQPHPTASLPDQPPALSFMAARGHAQNSENLSHPASTLQPSLTKGTLYWNQVCFLAYLVPRFLHFCVLWFFVFWFFLDDDFGI